MLDTENAVSDGSNQKAVAKFGTAIAGGYQQVPDVLFKSQKSLGLTAIDVVILLNILMHWWEADEKPFPRLATIAQRMDVTVRTIERRVNVLEKAGFLKRLAMEDNKGRSVRRFDMTGLVEKLQALAVDERLSNYRRQRN